MGRKNKRKKIIQVKGEKALFTAPPPMLPANGHPSDARVIIANGEQDKRILMILESWESAFKRASDSQLMAVNKAFDEMVVKLLEPESRSFNALAVIMVAAAAGLIIIQLLK